MWHVPFSKGSCALAGAERVALKDLNDTAIAQCADSVTTGRCPNHAAKHATEILTKPSAFDSFAPVLARDDVPWIRLRR
jgi:hypothetical protein